MVLSPAQTTEYHLTAYGGGGEARRTLLVAVLAGAASASTKDTMIEVPNVLGMKEKAARERLQILELRTDDVSKARRGLGRFLDLEVVAQTPNAGAKVARGQVVELTVSLHPRFDDPLNENRSG